MTIFLQYTISFMLLSMVIAASYYGLDDYQPDNDDGDAPNVKREKGGCKYPGRACSAGGWYSYGCYFSHMLPGGLKVKFCWRQCWSNKKTWCTIRRSDIPLKKNCIRDSDCVPDDTVSANHICRSSCKTGNPPFNL